MISRRPSIALYVLSLVYVLGWGYAATLTSFWYDEDYTAATIELPWRAMFHTLRGDWAPPLFFIMLKPWHAATSFMGPELSLRSFSLLSGLLALWVWLRVFERLLPDSDAPYLAFVLLAVSPFTGWYATEARYYQFYLLVAGLAWWSLLRLMDQPASWRLRVLTGFFCACVPFTHITGVVGALAFVLWLLLGWRAKELNKAKTQAALWAMLFAGIFFFPQLDTLNNQVGRIKSFWAEAPGWNFFQDLAAYIRTYFFADLGKGGWPEGVFLAGAIGAFFWSMLRAPWPLRRMAGAAFGGFFLAFWMGSHMTLPFLIPRVTLPWVPLLFLAIAFAFEQWGGRRLMAAALIVLVWIAAPIVKRQHSGSGREDMRSAVAFMKAEALPGDQFITISTLGDYYMTRQGLHFSHEGDSVLRRFWVIRRKTEILAGKKPWMQPEAHAGQYLVLKRQNFESTVDPFWTLELLLAERGDKKSFTF